VDAGLEVAVAGKDGGTDEIARFDGVFDAAASSGPELPMQVVQP
jgi:hypothetical protein